MPFSRSNKRSPDALLFFSAGFELILVVSSSCDEKLRRHKKEDLLAGCWRLVGFVNLLYRYRQGTAAGEPGRLQISVI